MDGDRPFLKSTRVPLQSQVDGKVRADRSVVAGAVDTRRVGENALESPRSLGGSRGGGCTGLRGSFGCNKKHECKEPERHLLRRYIAVSGRQVLVIIDIYLSIYRYCNM